MSALQRRSRSKTAPDSADDIVGTNGTAPTSNADLPDPSTASSPTLAAASTGLESLDSTLSAAEMLSTLPTSIPLTSEPAADDAMDTAEIGFDDHPDNGSSSLSELGDASDEQSEQLTPRALSVAETNEIDSEAETERLENTPRKLTRTGTETSMASEQLYERTPSKLIQSTTVDEDDSVPASPTTPSVRAVDSGSGNAALDTLSFLAASEAASLEIAGKKRKRSSVEGSSAEEPADEPARKRSSTIRDPALNGNDTDMADGSEQVDIDGELDQAEERIEELAQEEVELEQRQAEVAAETVNELATVAKLTKPRKGGRRGKRKIDESSVAEAVMSVEAQEAEGEEENDEEDSAARDEEAAKKKAAIEELAKIERKFKIFREKLCDEQMAQYEQELEMLRQPNCTHPQYLAMLQSIDERRTSKIAYEKQLLEYKQKTLERTTIAERHQLHSQYFQTVRDVRETILSECNQRVYELQRGRRQLGVEEVDYSLKLPEKRSEQIRQQTAYNLEVSIISGVAKYVGFPAAPEIKPARPSEIDDDLRAMKITTRTTAQQVPYVRPTTTYRSNATADEAAAEEQFIERTPWANPQHPVHQQAHYSAPQGPPRAGSQSYQTPAGQRRMIDLHAPNGSASTIEANSNPPSSAAGQGLGNGRIGESESPVLQMKRNPSDHPQYDTSGSGARNLQREPPLYASMLSSPADQQAEEQGRWAASGIRPLNSGPPSVPTNPGRQVPLTQRSGLGAVSVGSGGGGGLFGR